MSTVRVIECTYADELHRHYDGQTEAQDCYIELDLREGTLLASYNAEVGNAVPFTVYHGFERRYGIPVLTGDAADRAMEEIRPLAERILADWEEEWDERRGNMVARLGEDAQAAEEEIEEKLGDFDESDMVTEWDINGATNGCEVDEYGITADTTDERLDEIEATILKDLADVSASDVVVCHGLDTYLRELRDKLAEDDPLTPAELRAAREYLGLTGDHLAKRLGVNPRTLRSWEQGRDPIPGRIRPEIAELKAAADKAVAEIVESCQSEEEPVLITYRDDDEYQAAHRGGRWTASWHRRVCARVAERTGARIDYTDDADQQGEA